MLFPRENVAITGVFRASFRRGPFITCHDGTVWRVTAPWRLRRFIRQNVHAIGTQTDFYRLDVIDMVRVGERPLSPPSG